MCFCLTLLIISQSIYGVIIAFFFNSLGFCLKGLTETNILAESINMKSQNSKSLFALAYSAGLKNYMILDGITSFFIGLTYAINPYFPIIISLVFTSISALLSAYFNVKPQPKNKEKKSFIKEYKLQFTNLKKSFKKFIKSRRLKALMLFTFLFSGFLYGSYSIRETMLTEFYEIDATWFGIIIASLTIIGGLAEILQDRIQKIFKNRTFTFLSISYVATFILIFVVAISNIDNNIKLALTLLLFAIEYCIDSLYTGFTNTYQKNFTTNRIRVKISSVFEVIKYFSNFLLTFIFSIVVGVVDIENAFLYIGIVFLILFIFALIYMKSRFGLKPEQYSKSDIY